MPVGRERLMFSESDLERIADDTWKDRRITSATYCGVCGYNLRTLPYVYNCPECGGEYNARPLVMKGIFLPVEGLVPASETWAVLVWAGIGYAVYALSEKPIEQAVWMVIGVCAALCAISIRMAYTRWRTLIRHKVIEARILREENEGGS